MDPLWFDFHGVRLLAETDDAGIHQAVAFDFSRLRAGPPAAGAAYVSLSVQAGPPPPGVVPPEARRIFRTKDAIVLKRGRAQYYLSPGRALVTYDFEAERGEIYGEDGDLVLEKTYLLALSRVGALLDRRGLHRLHAMGVARGGRAILCLLPTGGGKTTLALGLLAREGYALLSEEIPLVARDGRVLGLPIRIGVTADTPLTIPVEFLRPFRRSRQGPKTLIDAGWLDGRLATTARPGLLLVGSRRAGPTPALRAISRLAALPALLRLCVVGSGLPQLREYAVRCGWDDALRQLPIHVSRLRASLSLLARSSAWALELGEDRTANATRVAELVERALAPSPKADAAIVDSHTTESGVAPAGAAIEVGATAPPASGPAPAENGGPR